jgi:hypothetical protein
MLSRYSPAPLGLPTLVVLALLATSAGLAQAPASSSGPPQPASPVVTVSGLIFGNYQYHLSGQSKDFNQFVLDRAYVNVRATLTDRLNLRITTDVFQSGDQNGWTIRAKYAYLHYDLLKRAGWSTGIRAGMLHNVLIEHVEQFWPRFVERAPLERSGGFASADVGVAALLTLPARWGEVYAHVVNGPGYTRRETDRFKDYAARVTVTPLAGRVAGPLSTLTISPWIYEGAVASRFERGGGGGAIAPVGGGLPRDRHGVVVGIRDPRLTAGVEAARMHTVTDTLGPAATPTRAVSDVRTDLLAAYGVLRPLAFFNAARRSRFGFIGRYDGVEANTAVGDRYHFLLAGLLVDWSPRSAVVLNYQEQLASAGVPPLPAPGAFRAVFANVVVSF